MKYKVNRRTGDKISVLGIGTSTLPDAEEKEAVKALQTAAEGGINYFDLATAHGSCFGIFGKALSDVRKNLFYQIHFGADYTGGAYAWAPNLDTVKRSLDYQLKNLNTDYIDYGFIHCIDEQSDWTQYVESGILDYIKTLQTQGVVKHIGLSSHTPSTVHTVLDTNLIDMLMFSINPAYDYEKGDEYAKGSVLEREALYRRCEAEGVGISVMKPYCGGQLLDVRRSPFNTALTDYQCLQYALDKPGVLTVLPGVRTEQDIKRLLAFLNAEPEEKDYSVIASFTPARAEGKCVYCNHCQPCPKGIDIGLVNKYYDLANAGDTLAANHYQKLEVKADACVSCGHCNRRCPFGVDQQGRMKEIQQYFCK